MKNCNDMENNFNPIQRCCCYIAGLTEPTEATYTIDSILFDDDKTQTVAADSLVDLGTTINSNRTSITFTGPITISVSKELSVSNPYHNSNFSIIKIG